MPDTASVLVYGLFFAAFVATVVTLLLAFRRRAHEWVDARYPPSRRVTSEPEVTAVESMLHLAEGPLRSPWALVSVLAPVVTGALAAYVPELAAG